ncbi:Multimeric flavodoxin WrbA [Paramaledivibacter caminithermalis DSM 15212]|uniref:Multimeric flavodoxin WrbA n=1 Tax=Paramaledivibacter caminithermalis (strain DSM 15212 / CIP 107654 / DViRD3) TaxID=1121301 RepID=A0A1M6MDF3_PARC5|nr:Multimeric flavodoxin WrbA [Paramaledivibacter caminithermalis DSM 15212]
MKIIGICGSPREKSNTEFFVQLTLDELKKKGFDTEFITLRNKKVQECSGCYYCANNNECKIKDDFDDIFREMLQADGIILGSPVYHSSITPKLKALLDRAGFLGRWVANDMKEKKQAYDWKGTAFSGKVVSPITVARRAGQNFTFAQLLLWATVNDCIVVGSNYWNVGVAGKGGNVDAHEDTEGIGIMKHLAENMAHVIKQLNK